MQDDLRIAFGVRRGERRYKSPIDDMQRAFLHIERGFSDGFAQGGMRMSSATDVFGTAAEFNDRNSFGN